MKNLRLQRAADTLRTVHNNNLFFYSVDSLSGMARYYPSDGVGRPAPGDIFDVKASDLFVSYQPYFSNDWIQLDGSNDYHVLASSEAIGNGFTPPAPSLSNHWWNPYFINGTDTLQLPGDANIGAHGTVTAVSDQNPKVASKFALNQNFPNPFNPSTVITYQLPTNSFVTLKVYDVLGREVKTLVSEHQNAGLHNLTFDASNLPSGIYLYHIQAGNYSQMKKMVLVK